MACYSEQEIADEVGLAQKTITNSVSNFSNLNNFVQITKLAATYQEEDFKPPLYNLWNDLKLTRVTPPGEIFPSEFRSHAW